MNTIKEIIVATCLVLSLGAISNITVAADTNAGVTQHIKDTNAHLEAALGAVNANDLEAAQEHIKAARQSSKGIIGGTYSARTARGSSAMVKARLYIKKGNTDAAVTALKKSLEIFNSMLRSFDSGSQGGLK